MIPMAANTATSMAILAPFSIEYIHSIPEVCFSFIISLLKYVNNIGAKNEEKPAGGVENAISQIVTAEEESDETDDLELVAVITAAIAASEGTSSDGLVVRSIKRRF